MGSPSSVEDKATTRAGRRSNGTRRRRRPARLSVDLENAHAEVTTTLATASISGLPQGPQPPTSRSRRQRIARTDYKGNHKGISRLGLDFHSTSTPIPGLLRRGSTKTATQPSKRRDSSSDAEMINDPLPPPPLLKAVAVGCGDEDLGMTWHGRRQ